MIKGYKDIEFIKIPETWQAHLLGSEDPLILKEIRNGLSISQSKEKRKIKVSRIETISYEIIDETRVRFVEKIDNDKFEKYLIKKDDILFSHINSDPHLGKTAIAEKNYADLVHGMNLLLFKVNKEVLDPYFLNYIFRLYRHIGVFLKIRSRAVNQSSINQNKLKNVQIPVPPLPEQIKIVYVLKTLQKTIEKQDRLIRQTTELKKALMQKLFTEGIKGEKQKQSEIGLVPESWEVKPLIKAVEFIDYGVSQAIPKNPPSNGVKIVSTADINRSGDLLYYKIRTIAVAKRTAEKLELQDGDLLFNWRNSAELIGKSTIYHKQVESHIFASFILRINCGEKKSHNYFMKYLMNHYREEGVFIKLSRRAVNQANFNRNEISVLPIPSPPYKEQVAIAEIITKIENKVNLHKSKKQTLSELFKVLLHELMTGKRRVNELEFAELNNKYKFVKQPLSMVAEK